VSNLDINSLGRVVRLHDRSKRGNDAQTGDKGEEVPGGDQKSEAAPIISAPSR